MKLSLVVNWLKTISYTIGWLFLVLAPLAAIRARLRPGGREEAGAKLWLSLPLLLMQTGLFFVVGWWLWVPLPVQIDTLAKNWLIVLGTPFHWGGLALYAWGMQTLGRMFGASSTRGVRLHAGHQLITSGPFRFVRHPMYLGVILAAFGGLLIYQTQAMAIALVGSFGLALRAQREERVLAEEFEKEWTEYAARTPGWIPRRR